MDSRPLVPPEAGQGDGPSSVWYAATVFFPAFCMFTAFGASLLTMPLTVQGWGLDVGNVAYLTTVKEVSELVANFPASTILVHVGARGSMLLGSALYAAIGVPLALAPDYASFALFFLFQGVVVKVYNRGQGAILKDAGGKRGRVSSTLVTCKYVAMAAAPHLTARMAEPLGGAQHMYFVQVGLGILMVGSLLATPRPPDQIAAATTPPLAKVGGAKGGEGAAAVGYGAVLRDPDSRRDLAAAASMCSLVSMLRGAYNVLLPVSLLALGLPPSAASLSMSMTYGVAAVFPLLVGRWLDAAGRRPCAVASMVCFAVGHGGLGLASLLGPSDARLAAVVAASALALGLADSLSAPLGYTLKGDAAASEERRCLDQGWAAGDVKARVARFMATLDVALDFVGIFYPIALGLVATKVSVVAASFLFAGVACAGFGGVLSSSALSV